MRSSEDVLERMAIPNASDYVGYPFYTHVFQFERDHDTDVVLDWFDRNWKLPFYIDAVYLLAVYLFHRYMKNRAPVDVRKPFFVWNVVFAIFSICGMLRGLPEITFVLRHYGLEYSVCQNKYNSVSGFWATAFVLSKGAELFETVFLLLRKRLNWIHLFHHVGTFTMTWYFSAQKPALGRWGGCFNFTVHAFMYTYFALKSAKVKIPEKVSLCVTLLQLTQFVILGIITVYVGYLKTIDRECHNPYYPIALGIIADIYFINLFLKYTISRYFSGSPKSKTH